MLFIGTQFSNIYTAVDTPAETAWYVSVRKLCVDGLMHSSVMLIVRRVRAGRA